VAWSSLANPPTLTPKGVSARSRSGQFTIYSPPSALTAPPGADLATKLDFVSLDPTLLAVSCERIKQNLARELGATDAWRGKIFLFLYPATGADAPVTITSEHFRDGWEYRVEMPNVIQRTRYVRAVTQVLLLEMANRSGGDHSAELPLWLTEGMSQQLLSSSEIQIVLPKPTPTEKGMGMIYKEVDARREDPLGKAHERLSVSQPITFDALSWPPKDVLNGDSGEVYRSSAQLFVTELLRLPGGQAAMRAMLAELPQYLNWQLAFLHAFRAWFSGPLDVEKWWALDLAHFMERDLTQVWPLDESWQKLTDTLSSPVQIRTDTNQMPLHSEVSLQTIVRDWNRESQTDALKQKMQELQLLRLRIAPKLTPLVDGYRQTLETFLQKRDEASVTYWMRKQAGARHWAEQTIRQLDELDARREAARPPSKPEKLTNPQPATAPTGAEDIK
jgi:hypothetical protein